MKKISTLVSHQGNCKLKQKWDATLYSPKWLKWKIMSSVEENASGVTRTLRNCWEDCKLAHHFGKLSAFREAEYINTLWTNNFTPEYIPSTYVCQEACIRIFTAVLFVIVLWWDCQCHPQVWWSLEGSQDWLSKTKLKLVWVIYHSGKITKQDQ